MLQRLLGKMKVMDKAVRESLVYVNEKIVEFNKKLEKDEIILKQCFDEVSAVISIKYDKLRTKKKNKDGSDDEDG